MTDWMELEHRYYFPLIKRLPLTLVRGEGTHVYDESGREYLDFVAGIASVSLGHCHPAVVQAIEEQARRLMQPSNFYYNIPQSQFAEALCKASGFDRVFFANSGTEAVEGALKLARKWGKVKRDGAYEVIVAENAFHGRTFGALTATGNEKYRQPFTPLLDGFVRAPFNDLTAIKEATTSRTAAVLLEPIQGEAGVVVPADDYLPSLRAWCDEAGILLIFDEVQTGMGRCGALFAHQLYGVKPDVMALAKGLGGGFPVGAFLAQESCAVFGPTEHASTFGGNPLACHVGHAVLQYMLEHDLPAQAARKGNFLLRRLYVLADRYPIIEEVRGKGLLWAVQLKREVAEQAVQLALDRGLLINNVRPNTLRLMPPLTVSEEEIEQALAIVEGVLADIEKQAQ